MRHPLLALVAKAPVPGRVKTRLAPHLGPREAASLYRAFLLDAIGVMADVRGVERCVILPSDSDQAALAGIIPADLRIRRQPVDGLTDALGGTIAEGLARGHAGVVIFGSDNPSLPAALLGQAVRALADCELVIGPATDGGYYLIGLSRNVPALFEEMVWSTPEVFAQTIERARRADLTIACLPPWYDVDRIEDVRLLAAHLAADPTLRAPATRQALGAISRNLMGPALSNRTGEQPAGTGPSGPAALRSHP